VEGQPFHVIQRVAAHLDRCTVQDGRQSHRAGARRWRRRTL
jgi:hypothetical protein